MRLSGWKRAVRVGLILCVISAPVWGQTTDKKHRLQQVPEGGAAPVYVVVSAAAILGGILLARRQNSSKALAGKS